MDITEWLPEFPVSAEEDDDLMRYFLSTQYVKELTESRKWIVIGRKGIGKTAIYKYLQSTKYQTKKRLTVPLDFKDYPWPIHQLYKERMEGEVGAYSKSWEYIILVSALAKLIDAKTTVNETQSPELKNANKLLTTIYGRPNPTLIDVIKNKLYQIDKLKLPAADGPGLSFSGGEVSFDDVANDKVLVSRLKSNAFTLCDYLRKVLSENIGDYNITVAMDQLDENWLSDQIQEYSRILISLIIASKAININTSFKSHLRVVPFLRTDIFDTLRFNDKNKIYQSSAIDIRWDAETLDAMFTERIRHHMPKAIRASSEKSTDAIFSMKTVRHQATPFRYILRRTFYRPRDIVVYFNKIRSVHVTSRAGLYTSKELYGAEKDYSISMYNELIDEWANQKPEIEDYLSALQNIGTQVFGRQDFIGSYAKVVGRNDPADANRALLFLFSNSMLGQKISLNWEYICTNPHMQVDFNKQFHVNNALKSRLTLTEARTPRK